MSNVDKMVLALFVLLLGPLIPMLFYLMFVLLPVSAYTGVECLEQGYPKYTVDILLNRYCMNLEGTVTVSVDKLQ